VEATGKWKERILEKAEGDEQPTWSRQRMVEVISQGERSGDGLDTGLNVSVNKLDTRLQLWKWCSDYWFCDLPALPMLSM